MTRAGDGFAVTLDGLDSRTWHVDAARVDAHTLSLIVDSEEEKGAVPLCQPAAEKKGYGSFLRAGFEVTIVPGRSPGQFTIQVGAVPVTVNVEGRRRGGRSDETGGTGPQRVTAPMPGKVVRLFVRPGDAVVARQPLIVVEAMKMENELRARRDGTVTEVHAREGLSVDAGALLIVIQ